MKALQRESKKAYRIKTFGPRLPRDTELTSEFFIVSGVKWKQRLDERGHGMHNIASSADERTPTTDLHSLSFKWNDTHWGSMTGISSQVQEMARSYLTMAGFTLDAELGGMLLESFE